MADQYGRAFELRNRRYGIGHIVVEADIIQRLRERAAGMASQAHGVRRVTARGKPGQKKRVPAPRTRERSVDEQ
jgi:hypothetical protein